MVLQHRCDVRDRPEGENRQLLASQSFRDRARGVRLHSKLSAARRAAEDREIPWAEPSRDLSRDRIAGLERRVPENHAHASDLELVRMKSLQEREAVVGLVAAAHHRGVDVHPDGDRENQGTEHHRVARRTRAEIRSASVTARVYSGGLRSPPM